MNRYAILSEDKTKVISVILADESFMQTISDPYIPGDDIEVGFVLQDGAYVSIEPIYEPTSEVTTYVVDELNEDMINELLRYIDEDNA